MVSKEFVEDMFPQWPGQDDDPQLNNLIRDLHSGRYVTSDYWDVKKKEEKKKTKLALVPYDSESEPPKKKQKKDKKHEGEAAEENEAADIEKKEDANGKGLSQDAEALNTIVATLGKIASKFEIHDSMFRKVDSLFEKFGSQFEAIDSNVGQLSRKIGDMEKKIGDYAKDAVDERLKVLGLSESAQNYVPSPKTQTLPRHKSVNSPTVLNTESETPDNVVWAKKPSVDEPAKAESRTPQQYFPKMKAEIPKGTPDELGKAEEKAAGSKLKAEIPKGTPEAKKNLFGSGLADFVSISPAKSPAKQPDLRRRSRRQKPIENEADLKKKADDAAKKRTEAAAKRKENAAKKKEEKAAAEFKKKEEKAAAELKKKEENAAAELKNKPAELKKEVQTKGLRDGVIRIPIIPATPGKKKGKTGGETDLEDVTEEAIAKGNELLPESDEDEDERLRLAGIKNYRARVVQLASTGLAAKSSTAPSGVFPYVFGDKGTTCMRRKDFEPSSAIYDPLSPVEPDKLDKLMQHLRPFEDIPLTDGRNEEVNFYRILISERAQWPKVDYGWLFDTHVAAYIRVLIKRSMEDPSPFCSKRIAFVDQWFLASWIRDFNQFKMKPKMFKFKDSGYELLINGAIPDDLQTNKKWLEDVDHLYGVLHTGGDHWVAFHVDLLKEKIDAYDPIIGQVTPESQQKMVDAFRPLMQMIPAMINAVIPGKKTGCKKQFAFRWKSGKNIPQNTQVGDCGVYSLKFIECLALGVTFDGICDVNIQGLRLKMAAEIFDEGGHDMYGQFN